MNVWLALALAGLTALAVVTAVVVWLDRGMDKVLTGREVYRDDDPAR